MPSLTMLLFNLARWKMGLTRLHRTAASIRRQELTAQLRSTLGDQVLSGPFKGMILPSSISWRDGDFMPKLVGSYESNLRPVVQEAIQRSPGAVINIGCAEGYYAIGLARALPNAVVHAFDFDQAAMSVCTQAAQLNDVSARLIPGGRCSHNEISRILQLHEHVLLFLDCEGAERELLDPGKIPKLVNCDIIVETHGDDIFDELMARFRPTHRVIQIEQGGRDPNELPELRKLHESDRWILMDEGRPESMRWLAFWTKSYPAPNQR